MRITIEIQTERSALKKFLDERQLRVAAFLNNDGHVVLFVNPSSRLAALELIGWLISLGALTWTS